MRGFSLVELSIVIVILGLLTGGILAGQNLIHAAEIRKTMAEADKYIAAIYTFRDQYAGIPGDFKEATRFWTGVANGDGDGHIETAAGAGSADSASYDGERPQFFIHLNKAGLLEGAYDGSTTLGLGYPRIPASPGHGMFVSGRWDGSNGGNPGIPDATASLQARAYLAMTITNPAAMGVNSGHNDSPGPFTPEDAWNMDTKKDDGLPHTGGVVAHAFASGAACTTAAGTEYALNQSAELCGLYWELVE